MPDLTKEEKYSILILIFVLAIGSGLLYFKENFNNSSIQITQSDISSYNRAINNYPEKFKKVNINTSDINTITSLSGIGEGLAQRIIEYRRKHGTFTNIEDIRNVSGIGEKKFNKIKKFLTIE